ncbi:MAG: iron ABC transporter permease [Chloroflexi bacterium]|nr:iron ABC transporter permease [Chloroflexota bacterium]
MLNIPALATSGVARTGRSVAAPSAGRHLYRQITRRKQLTLGALSVALVLSILADVAIGPSGLGIWDVALTILLPASADLTRQAIVWDIRLPMALMAVVVGASLAVAGAEMQTILNNPLASPFTLGVSAAAGFGAAVALVLGVSLIPIGGVFFIAGNAFACAMLAVILIHACSLLRGVTAETMVLLGIALVFLFNALLALLQYVASEQALQQVIFWMLGSLSRADWSKVGLTAAVLVGVTPLFARSAWQLTALRLGDERARSLGVDVRRLRLMVLLGVSLLASVPVAFVGTIGFVGLVAPHVARMLVGEDQRYFLPTSALAGAVLLSLTSIVSKTVIPGVLIPIGIITSLVGVPFFLGLIFSRRRQLWS